jgi:predicted nucleotidyltransferase component of viral defense system
MSVSQERLRDASAETGFRAEALEKVIRLGELASDVFNHPFLGPALALKGGTALNLAFGPPPRLSVDLDLNPTIPLTSVLFVWERAVPGRVTPRTPPMCVRHGRWPG